MHVHRTLLAIVAMLMVFTGISGQAGAYSNPPTWMPMEMLNITYDSVSRKLAVEQPAAPAQLEFQPAGSYDPAAVWSVLNGSATSRRLGWYDPGYDYVNPATMVISSIRNDYGPGAFIWIENVTASPGLAAYLAVGFYGVNSNDSPSVDNSNPTGIPYSPIFGTGGSSTKWQWDGLMDHNTYAVPAAYITEPNQHFSATYRLYIGDESGNDIAPAAATTTTWGWTGPAAVPGKDPDAFSFASRNAVATNTVVESNAVTITGNASPCIVSIDGGEYAISTDNGTTWGEWFSAWTFAPVEVAAGNEVKVRQTSSPLGGTTTTATLYVCGISAAFQVTTADTVPEKFTFTPVTGAATSFATPSEVITVTGISGDVPISISGGTSPQFSVSTDGGTTWSAWSASTPATVTGGTKVKVRVTSSPLPFTATTATLNIGGVTASFIVTTGYMNPPSWMPMSMLSVTFDGTSLAVVDEATKLGDGVYPVMNYVAPGSYAPGKPWSILNGGVALSRQLGWDDPTAPHGNGIHVPGGLIDNVKSRYGSDARIWIELVSQSQGIETYFADGMWGVGGTGNAASGTPLVYTDPNGFPIIYADNFYGIFGTGGSPTKWQWDGTMMHNVYVVPAAYITQPNQLFTSTYRVYIGDSEGNDLAPSAATTEVWTWKGPGETPDNIPETLSFSRQTGVAPNTACESNAVTITGLSVPALISVTECEYSVSTDSGVTWTPWSTSAPSTVANGNQIKLRHVSSSAQGTTTTAVVTVGGVSGSFEVTTADGVPDSFAFTPLTGVDPATVYESEPITISGIDIAATVSISTGASYAVSTDDGSTWGAWNYTESTIDPNSLVKVRVTSSPNPETTVTGTLTVGGLSGTFSVTTNAYAAPPGWMPMTMLNISYDAAKNKLAIVAEVPPFPVLSQPASPAMFDPAKPWSVLNGKSYSRQLGWNPAAGVNAAAIQAAFGADASIWIEKLSASEGLETYLAIGKYGVNVNNSTTVDEAAGVYRPIFGTAGSSSRWKWDYQMDHNVYAVPAAYLTEPNREFTARYRIYIGDSQGKNLAPSVATTTTWTWQGPATLPDNVPDSFTFTSLTDVAPGTILESDAISVTGLEVPALVSIIGGEYAVSTDNGATWSAWTAETGTVSPESQVKLRRTSSAKFGSSTSAILTIGGVTGSFTVTTSGLPIKVPKVTGKSEAKARSTLASKKLSVGNVTRSFSATVKAGYVISQTPAAGAIAETGTSVDLVISDGPEPVTVPSVVGSTPAEAKATLSAQNLRLKSVTKKYSDTVPAGEVISQIPAAGASVAPGTSVNLVVSAGPAPVKVPKVVRKTEAEAEAAITAAGLTVGTVTEIYSKSVPAGAVIKQKPSAGTSAPPGTAVNLVVSLGRKPAGTK